MRTSINISGTKPTLAAIILVAALSFCLPSIALAIAWQDLPPQQQQILAPLSKDWDSLSKKRQNSYIRIAKRYPQLTPLKQQRFQEQMVRWAKLTPAQRQKAREKYRSFNQLSPEQREAAKQALLEQHAKKHPDAASAVQPAVATPAP